MTVLQRPWLQGGLACQDLHKYLLATMLTHAHIWLMQSETNEAVVLEASCVDSSETLKNLLYRGVSASLLTAAMKAVLKAWLLAQALRPSSPNRISPHSHLWLNPLLPEFATIPDPQVWAVKGNKYLEQICLDGELKLFDTLKLHFDLRYLMFLDIYN